MSAILVNTSMCSIVGTSIWARTHIPNFLAPRVGSSVFVTGGAPKPKNRVSRPYVILWIINVDDNRERHYALGFLLFRGDDVTIVTSLHE